MLKNKIVIQDSDSSMAQLNVLWDEGKKTIFI